MLKKITNIKSQHAINNRSALESRSSNVSRDYGPYQPTIIETKAGQLSKRRAT